MSKRQAILFVLRKDLSEDELVQFLAHLRKVADPHYDSKSDAELVVEFNPNLGTPGLALV